MAGANQLMNWLRTAGFTVYSADPDYNSPAYIIDIDFNKMEVNAAPEAYSSDGGW